VIIRISEAKCSPRRQINRKFYYISIADENKYQKYCCRALIKKKTLKGQYVYSSIEDSEIVLLSERNNAGLKKLSSSA
jgi:hypothetical protein